MFGLILPLLVIVIVAAIFGGFYRWARQQRLAGAAQAVQGPHASRHISLLTEAIAYVGAILILAAGIAAVSQAWPSVNAWGRVAIWAGAAALFLIVGILVRRVREPAIQRLVDVVWFLSAAGVGGAVGFATYGVYANTAQVTTLAVGAGIATYSVALWLIRRHALQNFALFTGLIVTICGAIITVDETPPRIAFAVLLWGFGLAWAGLGWRRYLEPLWVSVPSGVLVTLIAPSLAAGDHGWVYAIGVGTAAAAMAASVPLRNTPLLALGTLAMFGYVTSLVMSYFHQSVGVPGALGITGALILGLAAVTARLLRATRPPKPKAPAAAAPSHLPHRPDQQEPGAGPASAGMRSDGVPADEAGEPSVEPSRREPSRAS